MSVYTKHIEVVSELKAPKGNYNSFGKYKYRSCEDILEALKPVLKKHNSTLYISDDVKITDRENYVVATVTFIDCETGESISNQGMAREAIEKKGMDTSQITGTASSYARKYALNGMFCIDDTKDADTDEFQSQSDNKTKNAGNKISSNQLNKLNGYLKKANYTAEKVNKIKEGYGISTLNELNQAQYDALMTKLEGEINGNKG